MYTNYMPLGKLFHFSEPQFLLLNGIALLFPIQANWWALHKIIHVKAQHSAWKIITLDKVGLLIFTKSHHFSYSALYPKATES